MNKRIEQFKSVQKESLNLFTKKNSDYGDAFADYGVIGILVRLGDKIRRLQSITSKKITLVDDESLRDTLIDLHNYAAMAIMLLDENKKSVNLPLSSLPSVPPSVPPSLPPSLPPSVPKFPSPPKNNIDNNHQDI